MVQAFGQRRSSWARPQGFGSQRTWTAKKIVLLAGLFLIPLILVMIPSHFLACSGTPQIQPMRVLLLAGITDVILAIFILFLILREANKGDEQTDDEFSDKASEARLEHLVVPYLCLAPIMLTAHVMIIRWIVARELMGVEKGFELVVELGLVLLVPLLFTRKSLMLSAGYILSLCLACLLPLIPWFTGSWFIFGC